MDSYRRHWGRGGMNEFNRPNLSPRLCCCIKTQNLRLPNLCNVSSQRNNQIIKHTMMKDKRALNSQTVTAKENPG